MISDDSTTRKRKDWDAHSGLGIAVCMWHTELNLIIAYTPISHTVNQFRSLQITVCVFLSTHYENRPIQIYRNFTSKN